MTPRYLLDTNALSDLIRAPSGEVGRRLRQAGGTNACCSVVNAAELRYGAARKGSARLDAKVNALLGTIPVLALPATVDRIYATVRTDLERRGESIGPNDLLIAAHALHESLVLVTDNVREFSRVGGLAVENWRDPA